ncbi:MAG: GNAT family N-acetyltransferase [Clostridia bacterium]|nr:GNAT family N-acetyltransferase [Clostridia bacterium]
MDITVKKMETDGEIRGKGYVHYKAWQEAYQGLIDRDYLDNMSLSKCTEIAYRWLDNILVAKDGERVVGFVGYGKCRNDDLPGAGEVFAIYILKEYYGKGVGKALMDAALGLLSEYPQVAVWVLQGNERAIRFYQKCGFCFDGKKEIKTIGKDITELRMVMRR